MDERIKMIQVLIADDNADFCITLTNYLMQHTDFLRVQAITTNGKDALNEIKKLKPELILLDLKMPEYSGIEILQQLDKMEEYKPHVIVVSGEIAYIKKAYQYKNIDRVINKSTGFSEILEYISEVYEIIDNEQIIESIKKDLQRLDFNLSANGAKYLFDGIKVAIGENDLILKVEKDLYQRIGIINSIDAKKVKWNIDKVIKAMWETGNKQEIRQYFDLPIKSKPTSKIVIYKLIQIVENKKHNKLHKKDNVTA